MPALLRTPIPSVHVVVHDTAAEFLDTALPTLRRHERSANIILAHALKIRDEEAAGKSAYTPYPRFWITCWNAPSATCAAPSGAPTLDMVLSCVDWSLGTYPIFLWSPSPSANSPAFFQPRIQQLVECLHGLVPPERVYSVFGAKMLTNAFVAAWSNLTGAQALQDPFYAASYSMCTKETLTAERKGPLPAGHRLRRAVPEDARAVAELCQLFAEETVYFPQTDAMSLAEAREMIARRVLWVYEAPDPNGRGIAIASLCAVTRCSWTVAAITKVYTHPLFRQRGCAERLVRQVTSELLNNLGKREVVLYVGHSNSAAKVYDRIGFAGLCGNPRIEGVEDWLEIGFANADRGHW